MLDAAGQPGSLTAVLTPEGGDGPAGLAAVASDGTVRIAMQRLPATTGNQVYEAWVIGGDGVPQPLGSFSVGESGIAYFEGSGLPTAGRDRAGAHAGARPRCDGALVDAGLARDGGRAG